LFPQVTKTRGACRTAADVFVGRRKGSAVAAVAAVKRPDNEALARRLADAVLATPPMAGAAG